MKKKDTNPKGYSVSALLSENRPEKPENYIKHLDITDTLENIVATLGYDLRMSAPSHSIGHFTHPEWGNRLVGQYKSKGQVLALLNLCLGILNTYSKLERMQTKLDEVTRGARKGNIYKQHLFDAVGKEGIHEIMDTIRETHPELYTIKQEQDD